LKLHIVSQPVSAFGFSTLSVRLAMIQLYILFMVTPLFFLLGQVDRHAIEAARDLGGNWFSVFKEIILPQTMPGIVIGSIFIFVLCLSAPLILMAILSFQGYYGGVTFPFRGPAGLIWWRSIFETQVGGVFTHAADIKAAGQRSLWISLAAGAVVAVFSFTLSMAFRRRFRGDGVAF